MEKITLTTAQKSVIRSAAKGSSALIALCGDFWAQGVKTPSPVYIALKGLDKMPARDEYRADSAYQALDYAFRKVRAANKPPTEKKAVSRIAAAQAACLKIEDATEWAEFLNWIKRLA